MAEQTRRLAVIVTGGRAYTNVALVNAALDKIKPDLVLHGDADGADQLAERWCEANSVQYVAYPANWDALGKAAGPKRNGDMCDDLLKYRQDGYRIGVVAFPGNAGTKSCVEHAERRRIPVWHPARIDEPTLERVARKVQLALA